MEDYRDGISGRAAGNGGTNPDAQEAKRLRNQLVEYDGYLQEMRKTNMKNVETLDVIQRYTDKSAAGIQALTEAGTGMFFGPEEIFCVGRAGAEPYEHRRGSSGCAACG